MGIIEIFLDGSMCKYWWKWFSRERKVDDVGERGDICRSEIVE